MNKIQGNRMNRKTDIIYTYGNCSKRVTSLILFFYNSNTIEANIIDQVAGLPNGIERKHIKTIPNGAEKKGFSIIIHKTTYCLCVYLPASFEIKDKLWITR